MLIGMQCSVYALRTSCRLYCFSDCEIDIFICNYAM